jgi:putative oxidoreductase
LVASLFIVSGLEVLANPEPRAKVAKPVVDKVASIVPFAPTDPLDAVRLNAAVHLGAGVLLAAGVMSRLAALSLAVSMVPTTIAGHPFWEIDDPVKRSQQRVQFLKNAGIFGGLLVLALD